MIRRTTRSTRTDQLCPYTRLFRSNRRYGRQADRRGPKRPESRRGPAQGRGQAIRRWQEGRSSEMDADHRRKEGRSEEHTSELQSLMRNSYAVFCLKKTKKYNQEEK